jgi:hypothetical protein
VTSIRSASFAVALAWTLASPTNTGAQISDPEADRARAIYEAIMREAHTDKDLIQEFGAFVDPEEAGEKLRVCVGTLDAVYQKEFDIKRVEEGLGSVEGWLRTAQILAGKAQEKYRKTLDIWAEKKGPEATHYFDTTVKAERDAWQEKAAAVTKAEKALESERIGFRSRIEKEWNEIRSLFRNEGIEFADVSRASLGDLKAKLKDRCQRMWLWKRRGAEVIGRPEKQHPPFQPPDETPEGPPTDKAGPADAAEDKAPDPLVAAAEGAIADCDFKKVNSTIEGLAPGPIRDRLAERLEAAVTREQKTKALWQQAREEYRQGRKANAIALLEQAKANSKCSQYLARIEKALTKLDKDRAGEVSAADAVRWGAAWKGELRTQRTIVNGQETNTSALLAMIDADWARERDKARREKGSGGPGILGGIFKGFDLEIGKTVVGVGKIFIGIMSEGTRWSFALRPEGAGLRLVAVGDDEAAVDMNESLAGIPVFTPGVERQLKMSYQGAPGGSTVSAVLTADEMWARVTFEIYVASAPPDDSGVPDREIRTLEMSFSGTFEPGPIPAAELQAELSQRIESAMARYAPELKDAP